MEIYVDYAHRADELRALPVEDLVRFVLEAEQMPASTEVSVSFVTDEAIAALNEEFRGKAGPTDVLSFECDGVDDAFDEALLPPDGAADAPDDELPFELGDVVIAPDVARRQTDLYGTTFEGEVTLLLVHGLLHLAGFDHIADDEAEEMEAREREILGLWADAGHEGVRHVRDDTIRVRGEH
ncbi:MULTISPECIES: rRNA maturation RNase YbeY [unclassified Adlercreutzia]|uniref:rRNA maturation RNase YbeY n=1 Tax=unclassified Adlercreutzia TaxID=2636013 RepID=UPI0013EA97CF|nr:MULTISPECIES: rRNA maturation RNase YbeY [unclassified Adlercreutzia]